MDTKALLTASKLFKKFAEEREPRKFTPSELELLRLYKNSPELLDVEDKDDVYELEQRYPEEFNAVMEALETLETFGEGFEEASDSDITLDAPEADPTKEIVE